MTPKRIQRLLAPITSSDELDRAACAMGAPTLREFLDARFGPGGWIFEFAREGALTLDRDEYYRLAVEHGIGELRRALSAAMEECGNPSEMTNDEVLLHAVEQAGGRDG